MTATLREPMLLVRVMGVTIGIECPSEEIHARLAHQWSRALVTDDVPPARTIRAADGPPHLEHANDYVLTTEVTMAALQVTAGKRFNFHAGGLADDDGRVLAVVAPSGTGKTTATRILAQELHYLSDETVSLEPDGTAYPHAKPLSVLLDPLVLGHKEQLSPDELGMLSTPATGRLARLVVLRRGVPGPRGLVPLDDVEGLLELIEQSSSVGLVPDALGTLHALVASVGGVWALEYDEIADHVDDLLRLLADDLAPVTGATPTTHPGRAELEQPTEHQVVRAPWVDAIELGDEVVVLLDGRALSLDNLMATLWLELTSARTVAELTAAAQQVHGAHPDAEALVRQAVDVMLEESLVARGALA